MSDSSSSARQAARWLGRGTWTVLDQGLFAGANFVVNVLLARWLMPEAYGAFALAFTLFLLLATVHTGFLTEPMLVFGPARFRDRMVAYLGVLARGHLGFCAIATAVLLGLALVLYPLHGSDLARDLLILAAVQPFILWMWMIRRSCYAVMRPHVAALGSGIYALLLLPGAFFLQAQGLMSVAGAFGLIAAAALVSGAWIAWQMGLRALPKDEALAGEVRAAHSTYGRWAAATGGLSWVNSQVSLLLVPLWGGLAAGGAIKALLNLLLPAAHIYSALGLLMVPLFVRARAEGRLRGRATTWIALLAGGMAVGWIALGLFGAQALDLLYDGQYTEHAPLLWLIGLLPVLGSVGAGLASVLRAQERPDAVFLSYGASAVTALVAGVLLIPTYGLLGALLMHLLATLVEVIVLGVLVALPSLSALLAGLPHRTAPDAT